MRLAIWLYSALARAFPYEFRVVYGPDMIQLGEDIVQEIAKENGFLGLFRLVLDIAIRLPIEYLSEMRRDLSYAFRTLAKSPGFATVGIVSLGIGASFLSPAVVGQVAGAIAAWLSLSLPVGVLIGHCVLGED